MQPRYLLSDVDLGEEEALAVAEVVRGKWLSVGPRTAEFETAFAAMTGSQYAVAVSNCTAALHLALEALDIGPGDEVLVPSYTFVASANAVLYQGARPVFVDILGEHDLNLDPADLARKITPRSKAIIVVHLAGFPADMDAILQIAERHNLPVVEDACHAIGASYDGGAESSLTGRQAGAIGRVGCFSFFANKNLVTGEGGMVVTDDEPIARRVRLGRSHGMTKTSWDKADGRATDYDVVQLGHNYRGTELTAAMGLIQLRKLAAANARRREAVKVYRQRLAAMPEITIPFSDRLDDSAHHIFPVVLPDAEMRAPLREALRERGVQTSVHYPPVHQFSHYRALLGDVSLPVTEDIAAREMTLPLHPLLSEPDVHAICDLLVAAMAKVKVKR
ncbi:MAG: DegT/DnrJ/EryC1/StrS family aminotransferase [Pirellulaceae bacterium]